MPAKNSPAKTARQDIDLKTLLTDIIESYLEQVGRREWPALSGSMADALASVSSDDARPRVVPKR